MIGDNFNRIKVASMTPPINKTASYASGYVDRLGYESVSVYVYFGASGDTLSGSVYWSCKLQESDTSGSGYTDVAAADVIGSTTNAFGLVNDPAEDDAVYGLGYSGSLRYVKAYVTATGTHSTGTPHAIFAVLGNPYKSPTSQTVTPA